MDNLTDLEICKRIAEIDGINVSELNGRLIPDCEFDQAMKYCRLAQDFQAHIYLDKLDYNPLSNSALCFELMTKHKVTLYPEYDDTFVCKIGTKLNSKHKDPKYAICLSIVEHKGQNRKQVKEVFTDHLKFVESLKFKPTMASWQWPVSGLKSPNKEKQGNKNV